MIKRIDLLTTSGGHWYKLYHNSPNGQYFYRSNRADVYGLLGTIELDARQKLAEIVAEAEKSQAIRDSVRNLVC